MLVILSTLHRPHLRSLDIKPPSDMDITLLGNVADLVLACSLEPAFALVVGILPL